MLQINPHINFNGNAEEAFNFYKSVFRGEIIRLTRLKDLSSNEFQIPKEDENKVLFISLRIGNNVLKGNDVPSFLGTVNENENRSKIFINIDSREEATRIFNELSVGGSIEGPIGDSPWGTYFGMFRDKYGIEWEIEYDPNF